MGEATRAAREQVKAARRDLGREVDELGSEARSSLDLPAKVRRNPVQTVGLGAAVVLLAAGAPRRGLRFVQRKLRGGKPEPPSNALPKEVQRAIDDLGPDAAAVRARLDKEFAKFLARERTEGKLERSPQDTLLRLVEAFAVPFGAQASRRLTERLFAADPDRPAVPGEAAREKATGREALLEDAATVAAVDKESG
jgi:hypothetical protein